MTYSSNTEEQIRELKDEIKHLNSELNITHEREQELEDTRSAMLYMLEDLNSSNVALEHSKNEWETTFDAILDPIFILDKEFRILRCNKAYQRAAGLPFEAIINMPYHNIFPKMDNPHLMCLDKMNDSIGTEMIEDIFIPGTGKTYRVRAFPYRDSIKNQNTYSVHFMEDITEMKKSEDTLLQEMETTANLFIIAEATAQTTDINKLMSQVTQCCCKILEFNICLFYLWDRELKIFRPVEHYGLSNEMIFLFKTETLSIETSGLIEQVLNKKSPSMTDIPVQSFLKDAPLTAIIPLTGRVEHLGIITGIYMNPREMTTRDKTIMKSISHQVSVALEEARLYRDSISKSIELSQRLETIQIMHEIDKSILSTLNKDEILETVTHMITRIITCDRVIITLVDKDKKGFIYAAGFGIKSVQKNSLVLFSDTTSSEIVKTGRPQYVSNLEDIKELPFIENALLAEGFRSHIRVPIAIKENVIGVLAVGSKKAAAFSPDTLQFMEKLASQVAIALENSRLVTDLEELFFGTIKSLAHAIDTKSQWTMGHSERVTDYALTIAKKMGFDNKALEYLRTAGLLHDIGKIGTYDVILDKPGRLSQEEFEIIKKHPARGAELLSPIRQLKDIITWIKHHHERYDGKGYPDGLKGDEIPLEARILTVADTFDSMTAKRPYRETPGVEKALEEFKKFSGTQFDPDVVKAFIRCCDDGDILI